MFFKQAGYYIAADAMGMMMISSRVDSRHSTDRLIVCGQKIKMSILLTLYLKLIARKPILDSNLTAIEIVSF